jgi:2-polyprenyl-3-methyl-5-hydroxy-6-metoxy-1,4-benzoquinol methylase
MINYDSFAEQYDAMVKKGGPRRAYDYIIDQLKQESDLKGKTICDLGCGQGELSYQLSSIGAKVTGVDPSKKLLMYAQNLTDEVNWVEGDEMNLSPFRFAICSSILEIKWERDPSFNIRSVSSTNISIC